MYRGDVNGEFEHYGLRENDEKWAVFIQIHRFLHQFALISKGKHCLLTRHDYFDYNSTDFSQIIEKNRVWVG